MAHGNGQGSSKQGMAAELQHLLQTGRMPVLRCPHSAFSSRASAQLAMSE
jgi:hypothetical protein